MILIIGGAYQGKREYAKDRYQLEVTEAADFLAGQREGGPCILDHMEGFVLRCVQKGSDPLCEVTRSIDMLENKVILCQDISAGVVPVDSTMRAWREANGRVTAFLAGRADKVIRMFCGLPQILKQ